MNAWVLNFWDFFSFCWWNLSSAVKFWFISYNRRAIWVSTSYQKVQISFGSFFCCCFFARKNFVIFPKYKISKHTFLVIHYFPQLYLTTLATASLLSGRSTFACPSNNNNYLLNCRPMVKCIWRYLLKTDTNRSSDNNHDHQPSHRLVLLTTTEPP